MNNNDHSYAKMPIVCASSGKTLGYELLLRKFNGIALNTFNRYPELYSELSYPMLQKKISLDQAGKIRKSGQHLFINFTPAQLLCAGTLEFLAQLQQKQQWQKLAPHFGQNSELNSELNSAQKHEHNPVQQKILAEITHYQVRNVVIELTEEELDCDIEKLKERLLLFRCLGFTFAIDDFGVKASNLQRIFDVDHDFIKLDRGLLFRYNARNADGDHLLHLVNFCHKLNKKVIIEGVETAEDYQVAKACQADYLQGFYFGLPERIVE